jgi:Calpain family cysteine protease
VATAGNTNNSSIGSLKVDIGELLRLAASLDQTHTQLLDNERSKVSGSQVGNGSVEAALSAFYTNWDYRRKGLAERLKVLSDLLFKAAKIYAENESMLKQGFSPQIGVSSSRSDPTIDQKDGWVAPVLVPAKDIRSLLPPQGRHSPQPADVIQGNIGDCYFAAAAAAIVATTAGQSLVQSMITLRPDGNFEVRFADGSTEVVDGDLFHDQEHGRDSLAGGGGLNSDGTRTANWFSILEKAYAQRHGDSYGSIVGGHAVDVFSDLVPGDKPATLDVSSHTDSGEVWKRIQDASRAGLPACVAMTGKTLPGALPESDGHEMSILGTSTENGKQYVTIRNPWGTLHAQAENSQPMDVVLEKHGAQMGPPLADGAFKISVKDLSKIISGVETG